MNLLETVKENRGVGMISEETYDYNKKQCPFVQTPHDECYVNNMDSRKIEEVIYYCGANYEKCEIYKKYFKEL